MAPDGVLSILPKRYTLKEFSAAFGATFTCHQFDGYQQQKISKEGNDAVRVCLDDGNYWTYGVAEAFPGCGGCLCCKRGKLKKIAKLRQSCDSFCLHNL